MSTLRVEVVSAAGSTEVGDPTQFAMSYLVNEKVAIDAGPLGFLSPVERQQDVEHVFLSHSHIDHLASLPLFLDNVYRPGPHAVRVYGGAKVLQCLQDHVLNDLIWPDLIRLSEQETPFLKLQQLDDFQTVAIEGLQVTAVPVDHVVPTFAYIIETESSAIAIVSDTGPTTVIWERLNELSHLQAVFLESCFPNEMQWLAECSRHLTPQLFAAELGKLKADVPVYAVHLKPTHRQQVIEQLRQLPRPGIRIANAGDVYEF